MPRLEDTAYPRLKSTLSARDLAAVYTPTPAARLETAKGPAAQLGFPVLLNLFQRWVDRCRSVTRHERSSSTLLAP